MMRRRKLKAEQETAEPKGFDDYELKLGDVMRGERATMGKSLLDVQRELRIKASYISAIENCDPEAFETPGFIAGYVRSYARYLNLDPDRAFAQFCAESGFETAHGMSEAASGAKKKKPEITKPAGVDALGSSTAFLPAKESLFSRIEPGALGSVAVLVALIGALGYGGWSILTEVQRVKFAPVEQAPEVLSDLDPIQAVPGATLPAGPESVSTTGRAAEGLDRLYRPEALDVPVLVARDAPISTLNPSDNSAFAEASQGGVDDEGSAEDRAVALALAGETAVTEQLTPNTPRVTENLGPSVTLVAVRPAWVRVSAADGTVVFEKILDAGEEYQVPMTEEPPLLRAGMSGSLYASVNGELRGPLGPGTSTIRNVALAADAMTENYAVADLSSDPVAKDIMLAKARQLETPTE